MGLLEEINY